MKKYFPTIRDYSLIIISSLIQAISLRLFFIPANLASGGVSGISQLINHFTGWPIGLMVFVGNINQPVDTLESRMLKMRIGYHDQQWRGNCVAIGLSSGFLEPLESTGIYLIEMANWAMLEFVPRFLAGAQPQGSYNRILHNHYDNIADFLKMHYCLSNRRDTAFWRDNCDPKTIPQSLQDNLKSWNAAVPSVYDFNSTTQCFSATNYKFVLYGMGWQGAESAGSEPGGHANRMMEELAQRRAKLRDFVLRDTVPNRVYFEALQKL